MIDKLRILEKNVDWLVSQQLGDGRFDFEMADYICVGGYNVRGMIGAYRILGKQEYLESSLRWFDYALGTQLEDGSFYAHITQGPDAYGRLQSDAANALMGLLGEA